MSYAYRYVRHTSRDGTDGFGNGDPLIAEDLNKIEIALKAHDSAIADIDSAMDHVLSGINVISVNQIRTMLAAAEAAAAQAAADNDDSGDSDDSGDDDGGDSREENNEG